MKDLVQRVFAEILWVVSLLYLTNVGHTATIHEFEEHPDSLFVKESVDTLDYSIAIILIVEILHDTDLIDYAIFVCLALRL